MSRFVPAIAIFFVALLFRLIAAWQLGSLPISRTPQLDSAAYLQWAQEIVAGGVAWPPYPEHAPGYPFFLAAVLALFDGSVMAVRVVQAVVGAVGCVLTARIAAQTIGPKAFLWAGLLQAAYAPLIYLDTAILAESLLVFLLVLALERAAAAEKRTAQWLICGVALGAACIVRPTASILVPAFLIVMLLKYRWDPGSRRLAAALVGGVLILVAPVMMQNWRVTGVPMIQAYGGMNVYLGNRPSGDGAARARLGGEWDQLEGEASRAGSSRNQQDAYYLQRTFSEISDRPAAYLGLIGSKLWWSLQDDELRDTHSYYFFADAMPLLRWLPSFGWILALAAAGAVASRPREPAWLLAYAIAMLATIVFLVVGTRYRMPIVPAVIAMAGGGLAAAIDAVRSRRWPNAAMLAAVIGLTWAATEIRRDAASHNLSEEWSFTGLSLLQEGKVDEAEAAYRTAISLDESSFAWDGLGQVLQRRERRTDAREAFERAVEINPSNATAWLHLGLAYEFVKNPRAALNAYQQALSITPERAEAKEMFEGALRRYQRR